MIKLSLTGKILLGVLVLLVPLALTLSSVVQFGSTTINVARAELVGLDASAPALDAALLWQIAGPNTPGDEKILGQIDDYLALLAKHPELNVTEAALQTAGYGWMEPTALREAVAKGAAGDLVQFALVEDRFLDQVSAIADSSGLVLDPDIDSYYLMLGLLDSLPKMLSALTAIRASLGAEGTMPVDARIEAAGAALNLKATTNRFSAQVSRSIATDGTAHGTVEGYAEKVPPQLAQASTIVDDLSRMVSAAVTTNQLDRVAYEKQISALSELLDEFHDVALEVLATMLQQRISDSTTSLVTALAAALISLILGFVALFWVLRDVGSRVKTLVSSLGAVASGDLTNEVPARLLRSGDELGRLAASVKALRDGLRAQVSQIDTTSSSLVAIGATLGANSEQSAAAIEQMSATSALVAKFAGQQSEQTESSGKTVQAILDKIAQANTLTSNMAAQFFMFGQSMEANRRRIQSTAQEAQLAGELAATLGRTGEEGARSLDSLNQAIAGVVQRTAEIQEVVQIILDIADRSSLLSMNAAIEAAHAGSSGRGFAVVAEEIRKLADTSAKQAQTIKTLLSGIAEAAELTRARSESTAESFRSLNADIAKVSEAGQSISRQMELQEAEDSRLSEGLVEFTTFYSRLAESMELQMKESQSVQSSFTTLQGASLEISHSMTEQKLGMEQATEAVIQVRETAKDLADIIDSLGVEVAKFRLG